MKKQMKKKQTQTSLQAKQQTNRVQPNSHGFMAVTFSMKRTASFQKSPQHVTLFHGELGYSPRSATHQGSLKAEASCTSST